MTPREFESLVGGLLALSGCDVQPEMLLGHKKIDLYAEERGVAKTRRIVVECKQYSKPLSQQQVSAIYANYLPLQQSALVDEILIVTERGVAPSAMAMIREARGLSHCTVAELQNSVIDFSGYLRMLQSDFMEDGLAEYYIQPSVNGGQNLHEVFEAWLETSSRPLAILGSYGMGKTSFVKSMAAALAGIAQRDSTARIPIVIALSDIAAEQSLEGLLGRVLTTKSQVRRYAFDAFMELNRRGRFVIFLDGFDEMKHTLTWDQFQYNFTQLNRLVNPASRVVILGRPTAFLSVDERNLILHGTRRAGKKTLRDHEWPDYEEALLERFSTDQVSLFLDRYAAYLSHLKSGRSAADRIRQRLRDLSSDRLADLAARPVQLKILAQVLPQWRGNISDLSVSQLYGSFVDLVIAREQGKLNRQRFTRAQRRQFARELAFWLWTTGKGGRVEPGRIPASLFPPPTDGDTPEGVRRDMILACFLENKAGVTLYFPHRSFQEFLVAEKIVTALRGSAADIPMLVEAVTVDVAEFLSGLLEPGDLTALVRHLGSIHSHLPMSFLRLFIATEQAVRALASEVRSGRQSRWAILALAVAALEKKTSPVDLSAALAAAMRTGADHRRVSLFVVLLLFSRGALPASDVGDLLIAFSDAAFADYTSGLVGGSRKSAQQMFAVGTSPDANLLRLMRYSLLPATMEIELGSAFREVTVDVQRSGFVSDWKIDLRPVPDTKPLTLKTKSGSFGKVAGSDSGNLLALLSQRYGSKRSP